MCKYHRSSFLLGNFHSLLVVYFKFLIFYNNLSLTITVNLKFESFLLNELIIEHITRVTPYCWYQVANRTVDEVLAWISILHVLDYTWSPLLPETKSSASDSRSLRLPLEVQSGIARQVSKLPSDDISATQYREFLKIALWGWIYSLPVICMLDYVILHSLYISWIRVLDKTLKM